MKNIQDSIRTYLMDKGELKYRIKIQEQKETKLTIFSQKNLIGLSLNLATRLLRNKLHIPKLKRSMVSLVSNEDISTEYFNKFNKAFHVSTKLEGNRFKDVKREGPVIFYANHPFSGVDVFALAAEIKKVRPDVKVLVASFLEHFPGAKKHFFVINVLTGKKHKNKNKKVYEEINQHIKNGKALLVFPAGSVSTWRDKNRVYAIDPEWKEGFLRFGGASADTDLVPVFIEGQPSDRYLRLREKYTSLSNFYILREFADQIGSTMTFHTGMPIPLKSLNDFQSSDQLNYLRAKLYSMGTAYFKLTNRIETKLNYSYCWKNPLITLIESDIMRFIEMSTASKLHLAPVQLQKEQNKIKIRMENRKNYLSK